MNTIAIATLTCDSRIAMTIIFLSFFLGCIDGLRSLTGPAVVCCAAHLGWLHFAGTRLAFVERPVTLIVFTLLAIAELVGDKLPATPARTALPGLVGRIVLGGACGLALATSVGSSTLLATVVGSIGAVVGAFAGYKTRRAIVSRTGLPDFAIAIAEDAIAIAGGFLVVSRL